MLRDIKLCKIFGNSVDSYLQFYNAKPPDLLSIPNHANTKFRGKKYVNQTNLVSIKENIPKISTVENNTSTDINYNGNPGFEANDHSKDVDDPRCESTITKKTIMDGALQVLDIDIYIYMKSNELCARE